MGTIAAGERNKMLDALVGRTAYSANAGVWAKIHTGDPGAAGTSNAAANATRQQITFGSAATGGTIASTAVTEWTSVSTSETYSWVSFWTASTAGTFLGSDDLPTAKAVNAGDTFRIPSGDVTFSVT